MPNNTLKSIYQKQAVIKSYARSIEFYRQQPETYEPNLTWQLYSRINRENAAELVRLTPPDILAKIRIEVDRAPRTQEEWDGTLYFGSSTSRAGGSDAKDTYRQAVELLRELFARQAPTFQNPTH